MVETMRYLTNISKIVKKIQRPKPNKRGGYIDETVITLPLFIIAVMVMSSVILMYVCIQDANFIIATELRRAAIESNFSNVSVLVPGRVGNRIGDKTLVNEYHVQDYGYRTTRWDIDELILLKMKINLKAKNPLNIASEADYELSLVTRAYVGRKRPIEPMSDDAMSSSGAEAVFVFPSMGEKYHNKSCRVLHVASTQVILNDEIKRKYSSCSHCHSKKASEGSLVYVFQNEGESYHLPGCNTLKRNYIEMERRIAIKRGYKSCNICGG